MLEKKQYLTIRFRLAISLFLSGLGALVMEMAWIRYFQWVYGVASHSAAIVLGVFMLGLATGGIYWGDRVQRSDNPVGFLRRLLAVAGLLGILGGIAFFAITPFYEHVLAAQGSILAWLFKFLFVCIVVFPATFCMGGTLPTSTWLMLFDENIERTGFGSLSFFNMLGSFLGAILTSFYLVETLGYTGTYCSGVAILMSAILPTVGIKNMEYEISAGEAARIDSFRNLIKSPYAASSFLAGFILFALELIWYRLLTPLTGGSAYAIGIIFAAVLLGMAFGSETASLIDSEKIRRKPLLAAVFLFLGSLLSFSFWFGDSWSDIASWGLANWPDYPGKILAWLLLSSLLIMPASFCMGMIVPFSFVKIKKGRDDSGADCGILLGINSVGALTGSVLFGFLLLTRLGVIGCIRFLVFTSLFAGVLLLVYHWWQNRREYSLKKMAIAAFFVCILNGLLVSTIGPTGAVRHSSIGFGTISFIGKTENERRQIINRKRRGIIWERDGSESSLAIDGSNGLTLLINGKSDGNVVGDAPTQIMSGLIGAVLHPEPRSAFVVGLGTGCSAGWLGEVEGIELVDVAEIEPLVVEMASLSWQANQKVMDNPRVHLHFADARAVLRSSPQKYDLIFSEPSHPYRSGMAGLFSIEFFKLVDEKLDENGIFTHFAPGYGVDLKTFAILYATLLEVFPVVETWQTQAGDMFLLCQKKPSTIEIEDLKKRLMKKPFRQAMNSAWKTDCFDGFLSKFVGNTDLAKRLAAIVPRSFINTDDKPLLELWYAKNMGKSSSLIIDLRKLSLENGFTQPSFLLEKVSNDQLLKHFPTLFTIAELKVPLQNYVKEVVHRGEIHNAYLSGRFDQVIELGKSIPIDQQTILERLIFGHALIFSATPDKVIPVLQSLPGPTFPEGYFLLASYHFRCGEVNSALEPLLKFFSAVSQNPWVFRPFIVNALSLSVMMVKKEPALADSLFRVLNHPFAGSCLDEARRLTLLELIPPEGINEQVSIIESFEPNIPWYERFLQIRKSAYEKAANPLARQAEVDFEAFLANQMNE